MIHQRSPHLSALVLTIVLASPFPFTFAFVPSSPPCTDVGSFVVERASCLSLSPTGRVKSDSHAGGGIFDTKATTAISASVNPSVMAESSYPRPLHPGGFSLPPLVEDRLFITNIEEEGREEENRSSLSSSSAHHLLLVRPPDTDSLWEWLAYTKRETEADPSWGRVWPTAMALARFVLGSFSTEESEASPSEPSIFESDSETKTSNTNAEAAARRAVRTATHAVEIGCGLGVAGLAFAATADRPSANNTRTRTVTLLDREQYALHCAMASAALNGWTTTAMGGGAGKEEGDDRDGHTVEVRASLDDWTAADSSKNIRYQSLHLGENDGEVLVLASDVLYDPTASEPLARKIASLVHPDRGGWALIVDPLNERAPGCRDAFAEAVRREGGEVEVLDLPPPPDTGSSMADVGINGKLERSVLISVQFRGKIKE